jgi:hypothetical protein
MKEGMNHMSLRSLPEGTTYALNDDGMQFLPLFVRARLQYLADSQEWYPPNKGQDEETFFTYYEVRGKLSDGYYTSSPGNNIAPINIWIASDDNCIRSFYVGGSMAWLCPDSHYLFFDEIDSTLLPEKPDPHEWWCIQYEKDIKVIKILVCPSEEITDDFPDEV